MTRTRSLLAHDQFIRAHLAESRVRTFCRVRRVVTGKDLDRAYRLVDTTGRGENDWRSVTPAPATAHRAVPETAVFVAEHESEIVGILAVVPDTPDLGLPSDAARPRELELLRELGRRTAEITHAVLAPDIPSLAVLGELLRAALAQAAHEGCDKLFAAVVPHWERFFEDVLRFSRWDLGPCDGAFRGMRLNLSDLRHRLEDADARLGPQAFLVDYLVETNVYANYVGPWTVMAARTFSDSAELKPLLAGQQELITNLSQTAGDALNRRLAPVVGETDPLAAGAELTLV